MRVCQLLGLALIALCAAAQQAAKPGQADPQPANAAPQVASPGNQKLTVTEPDTLVSEERIPSGARIYVAPMPNGFENYVIAGLQKKKVPVVLVADRNKAEFEITGVSETDKAGWAKMLFLGSDQTNETASVKMTNLATGRIVFAYSVKKGNSARGKQSAGESCAKHIREKIID